MERPRSRTPKVTMTKLGGTASIANVLSVEWQELLEPHGQPGPAADVADPDEDARCERGTVEGVVTDRQRLPEAAEDDLLVGDQPTDAEAVHADPVDVRATSAVERGR